MKKVISILFTIIFTNSLFSQKIVFTVAPKMGLSKYPYNNKKTNEIANSICVSPSMGFEFVLPKYISVGTNISFLTTNGAFFKDTISNLNFASPYTYYDTRIRSIDVPLFLRFRPDSIYKSIYWIGGMGISHLINNDVNMFTAGNKVAAGELPIKGINGKINGSYFFWGMGYNFKIKRKALFLEFSFRMDRSSWQLLPFPTVSSEQYNFKRRCILGCIGVLI